MSRLKLCIVQPNESAYSETFIQAHHDRLNADIFKLYGGWFPKFLPDGSPLFSLKKQALFNYAKPYLPFSLPNVAEKALTNYLIKNKIQVVLAEYGCAGAAIQNACRKANAPIVVHFHGFDAYRKDILADFQTQYQQLFQSNATIIAVSKDMRQQLLDLGANPDRTMYLPYGVDLEKFSGANPAENPPHFIAVGRFTPKKAPYLTLLAFKKVNETFPEARLTFVGDGELLAVCRNMAESLGIDAKVDFKGPQSPEAVAGLMRGSRAFVQHSIVSDDGDSEGTPLSVLEASACGLPVVSTRHAGIKEAVIDGQTGFLVEEKDVNAMAERMIKLANEPDLALQLGLAGRKWIGENFEIGTQIGKLQAILENAARKY